MTPTPETDAHMLGGSYSFDGDFARKLERERDEAIKQLDRICKEGFGNDDTIGLEPADDYVLRQLKNERDEARQKLAVFQDLLNNLADPLEMIINYWDQDERLESMTAACWNAVGTAEKALQKIKPHLTWYDR